MNDSLLGNILKIKIKLGSAKIYIKTDKNLIISIWKTLHDL